MQFNRMSAYQWFFACPQFIEPLLAEELLALGGELIKIGHAGVQAQGNLLFAYRVMLWSRLASRATLQLVSGYGKNQTELSQLVESINWQEHLRPTGSLKVRFFGRNDDIHNTQFGAQWVKDQIADQFRHHCGVRPSVSDQPDIVVVVNLHKSHASIGLELNQLSLADHGYRSTINPSPLRENLVAACLWRAGWLALTKSASPRIALVDPLCGSGAFLIEAMCMALSIAPGLLRAKTVSQRWLGHDEDLWQELVKDAQQQRSQALEQADRWVVWGNDADVASVMATRKLWQSLGLPEARWSHAPIQTMPLASEAEQGLVISQLPFSHEQTALLLRPLYSALGQWLAGLPSTWKGALLADQQAPFALTDLFYSKDYRFLNGETECKFYTFDTLRQKQQPTQWLAEDLANRLTKNLRKLKNFIKHNHTNAYRIYDADIPEYALAIDRYADWLHVQEYAPPKSIDEKQAKQRLEQALMTLPSVLDVKPEHIVLKQRKQQKGLNQYEKQGRKEQALVIYEHGVKLKVNLTDYLDTGIFLDHRPMRWWMQQQAKDKTVLNLFCYTGTVSTHAAVGGAKRVDSVDMSATYLAWAQENFALNQLQPEPYRYRFIQANVLEWLAQCRATYDLIFLDPPTFSNSKRMQDIFDVQRDHVDLIKQCMRLLAPQGTLVFSNNFRKFKLQAELEAVYKIVDYRLQSLPEDFQRDPKIHGCWLISHN